MPRDVTDWLVASWLKSTMVTGFDGGRRRDLALDHREHLVRRERGRIVAVGGRGGVDRPLGSVRNAGVEADDGYVLLHRLVQLIHDGVRVERREADGGGILRHRVDQHLHLGLDVGFGGRSLEGDLHVVLFRRGFRSLLDRLPELMLEALRDDGDVQLIVGEGRQRQTDEKHRRHEQQAFSS